MNHQHERTRTMNSISAYDVVVVGAGSEIGDDFVTHPAPGLISFTVP